FEGGGPLAWGHVTGVPGCLPAAQLDCGDPVVRGDTNGPGTTRVLENYPCQLAGPQSGPEAAYLFVPPASGQVDLLLEGLDANLSLNVLTGSPCDAASCLAGSAASGTANESLSFQAVAGTEYFVVIDGNPGAWSEFTLTLTCPN
ncbi:MAG: hypothetical protein AAGN66_21530, partial [Acidobacteriota bacterium]